MTSASCHKKVGPCRKAVPRFYFDKPNGECRDFIYGGCDGNANNFETIEACQEKCDICQLPQKVGPCRKAVPRFYFDKMDGKCKDFIYGGCDGNANNFEIIEACQKICEN